MQKIILVFNQEKCKKKDFGEVFKEAFLIANKAELLLKISCRLRVL